MGEQIAFPGGAPFPVIEIAVEPVGQADAERLKQALPSLADDDPLFGAWTDPESGQTILGGISELQLDREIETLTRLDGLNLNIGAPQAAYRETISRSVTIDSTHKRPMGPNSQFARVAILFEPSARGSGYCFEPRAADQTVPGEYLPGVEKGLESARRVGLLAGFPVIDFKATLVDGAFYDIDSSPKAFEIVARQAFRELAGKAGPRLLEPVMKLEAAAPGEHAGSVLGDLNRRRGLIQWQDMRGHETVFSALVPLANLFGYGSQLKALTNGRGRFRMAYSHYEAVHQEPEDDDPTFRPAIGMRA